MRARTHHFNVAATPVREITHPTAEPKTARINMRLPQKLTHALKARAAERNIPYQRLIREALEQALRR